MFGLKQDNVATFGATSQRSREEIFQRRDVDIQRRDVLENGKNQRRDIGIARRDVLEEFKINVATFQRRVKLTSRRCNVATLQHRDVWGQRCDVTKKAKNVHYATVV